MLNNILSFLHIAPLAVIALLFLHYVIFLASGKKFSLPSFYLPLVIVLSSIGIISGHFDHDSQGAILTLVDPCLGYVASLLFVAVAVWQKVGSVVKGQ